MDLPKQVWIGPTAYEVRPVTDLKDEDGKEMFGVIDYGLQIIYIDVGYKPEFIWTVLMHECIHAILFYAGQHTGENHHEPVVTALGQGLWTFLQDNPDLLDTAARTAGSRKRPARPPKPKSAS